MDLQKAKILLEKINALYKSMSVDAKNVSIIEKDLMRSYVLQFYETLLDMPAAAAGPEAPPVEIIKSAPKVTLRKPEPEPARREEPPARKTVFEEEPEEVEEPKVEIAPRRESPPPPPPKPEPSPAPVERKAPPAPSQPIDEELEELFAFGSARELSEKLSELPISDIKKAMGLNERIFTVNELFGGDQAAFDATVASLNQFRYFDDAKNYLIRNVAAKYHWAAKDRKNKAKTFIKLVKRRYA